MVATFLRAELDSEAAASVLGEHVDVGEIGEHVAVGDDPREPDLARPVVEADDARRTAYELLDDGPRPALRPVGLLREKSMDGVEVDPRRVVVELEALCELPRAHRQ